jgi:hypothetical protein
MIYLVRNGGDVEDANKEFTFVRVPFLEFDIWNGIEAYRQTKRPRTLKTHLSADCLEDQVVHEGLKTIVVMRNPKDTIVSYYHFYKSCRVYGGFNGSFDDYFQMALLGNVCYGNIFDHYLGWWRHRDLQNVLILKYEDLVRDPEGGVTMIAEHCGQELTAEARERIIEATRFKTMKKNPKTNYANNALMNDSICLFMRKGQVGDWKNYFTVAQNEIIDKVIEEKFQGTGLMFDYE